MSDFVSASNVYLDNPSSTVEEVMEFLSKQAVEQGVASDADAVLEAFKAREAEGTTGMMGGFAIPHAKADCISKAAVFVVKFSDSVEWASMDDEPIKCAIALLIPADQAAEHLTVLSKVAVMLMNEGFRQDVLASDDAAAIAALINDGFDK